MIEREFIARKTKEFYIKKHIEDTLRGAEISEIKLKKIPLGEKIIVTTSRPSLIVGSKGANIRALTKHLKSHFNLENPQIEIIEIKQPMLDANVVARRIAGSLERFGSARFKGIGHKMMANVLMAGAIGIEIKISGKIPGARAKSWRFYQGYLKKCGDISISGVRTSYTSALLKSGIIGIQVRIMPGDLILPDSVEILEEPVEIIEEINEVVEEKKPVKKKAAKKKAPAKKKTTKKKTTKKKATEEKESSPVKEDKKETKKEVAEKAEKIQDKTEEKTQESVKEETKVEVSE
jgi:small subunit ribosomal protein S3